MLHTPTISNCEPAQPAPASEAVGSGRLDAPPVEPVPQSLRMTREPSRNFRLPPCNLNQAARVEIPTRAGSGSDARRARYSLLTSASAQPLKAPTGHVQLCVILGVT